MNNLADVKAQYLKHFNLQDTKENGDFGKFILSLVPT